jgi:hypothetical protein
VDDIADAFASGLALAALWHLAYGTMLTEWAEWWIYA